MRIAALILLIAAVGCEIFWYWGLHTPAGRAEFDEMAGMIPFAAAPLGLLLLAGAALLWWLGRRKDKG